MELLRQGMEWHYKYYSKDEELAKLELEARNKKIGLWSQPNPVPPWEYTTIYVELEVHWLHYSL